jgi:beta-glucanase (GH16 family)
LGQQRLRLGWSVNVRPLLLCSVALVGAACTLGAPSSAADGGKPDGAAPSTDASSAAIDASSAPDAGGPPDAAVQVAGADASGTLVDASILAPLGPTAPANGWALAFQDEFDDAPGMSGPTNGLAASKWNSGWYTSGIKATSQPVQSTEAEWYGPEGIVFPGDGAVHLRLFASTNATYGKSYESGCLTTAGHYAFSASQKRTVVEARIKVAGPNSQSGGYWPAFWLLSHLDASGGTGQWPPEIDIFEFFGNANDPVAHLHTTGTDINLGLDDSDGVTDLSLGYHTYSLDASTNALTFFLDGEQKWTHTDAAHIANLLAYDPLYILVNFQFGGYGGDTTGTVPNDMVVDYVRCWQEK